MRERELAIIALHPGDDRLSCGSLWQSVAETAQLREKRTEAQLWRHQPDQAPGQRFFQRAAVELLFLGGVQRHHPTGVVHVP